MNHEPVPFHLPYVTDDDVRAVNRVLKSGWLTMGQETFALEEDFSQFTGTSHSVALNSCTAALHLALVAADVHGGDEVILPANTFVATAEVVRYTGAMPVLADVDENTHSIDPLSVEQKITSKTRAIIPVHYAGHPASMDEITALAHSCNASVIEDAAHALPSYYKEKSAGTLGDAGCFSFYATKTITSGEGGMLVTENDQWAERVRALRLHGISKNAWNRYDTGGSWEYDVVETGYKYNMSDINAALVKEQLKRAHEMTDLRRDIAHQYTEAFSSLEELTPFLEKEECRSSWHLYPLKFNRKMLSIDLEGFVLSLKEKGIIPSVHFIPLYRFSAYRDLQGELPVTEDLYGRTLSLPISPSMSQSQVARVIEGVITTVKEYRR
jgi:dTDP-4-amino-4,6-dideoxygalactose transaminase